MKSQIKSQGQYSPSSNNYIVFLMGVICVLLTLFISIASAHADVFYIDFSGDNRCHKSTAHSQSIAEEIEIAKYAYGDDFSIVSAPEYSYNSGGEEAFIDTDRFDNTGLVALYAGTLKGCRIAERTYKELRVSIRKILKENQK